MKFSVPHAAQLHLSTKQVQQYELQVHQFENFSLAIIYDLFGVHTNKEQYPYSSLATPTLSLPASINLVNKFDPESLINLQSTSMAVKL